MLARVANNLFWMGRYLERAEHISRFLNVNYFASLDAPNELSQSRQFVLKSILFMADDPVEDMDAQLNEDEVLFDVGLNPDKHYSVLSCLKYARENAAASRDLISTELYEAINKIYHSVSNYPKSVFVTNGLYDLTTRITVETASLRAKIRETMLRDEVYAIIMMGVKIERAIQVIRIINSKYNDALLSKFSFEDSIKNSFEWVTLLKCVQSHDMMRRYYKTTPTSYSTLSFLILNASCPRSVMSSLNSIDCYIKVLHGSDLPKKGTTAFLIAKMKAKYTFMEGEEIEEDMQEFIEEIILSLNEISESMVKEYFDFY